QSREKINDYTVFEEKFRKNFTTIENKKAEIDYSLNWVRQLKNVSIDTRDVENSLSQLKESINNLKIQYLNEMHCQKGRFHLIRDQLLGPAHCDHESSIDQDLNCGPFRC